jgi:hypothetical protein
MLSLVLNPKHVCSTPLTLSDWRLGARTVDTSDQRLVISSTSAALNCSWPLIMSGAYGSAQAAGALGQHPLSHLLLPTSFFAGLTPYRHGGQGQPSMSSTSVVDAVGNPDSNPQGAHHQRLQLQW